VRRLPVLAAAAAVCAIAASPAGATNECKGLQACVPVAGPWVLAGGGSEVEFQLACPKGYTVGGLDAELSTPALQVEFRGELGSPVNPGTTTANSAVFLGVLLRGRDAAATFRPHIGCIPGGGGGQRVPTAYDVYPPSRPAAPKMLELAVHAGTSKHVAVCPPGQQLGGATYAITFDTPAPPTLALATSVHVTQTIRKGRVHLAVHAGPAVKGHVVMVQVDLVCAGSA
jgi:hypothetical protein